jgi:hypothetical protein
VIESAARCVAVLGGLPGVPSRRPSAQAATVSASREAAATMRIGEVEIIGVILSERRG